MAIWIALLAGLCCWKLSFKRESGSAYLTDYMSRERTNAVRGIFILIVFMSHFKGYVTLNDAFLPDHLYGSFLSLLGQRMVAPFLFLSGYGVTEALQSKGSSYVRTIPGKRFGGVLFRFDVAILVFILVDLLIKWSITLRQTILSFIGWDAVGNSNWYIFVILVLYLLTFLAFTVFDPERDLHKGLALVTVLALTVMLTFRLTGIKERYWYDTMLCYPLGMYWSAYGKRLADRINRKFAIWALMTAVCFALELSTMFVWRFKNSFFMHEVGMLLFPICVQLVMMRVRVCNPALVWCGKHLFGIYIMQRIPMNILKQFGLMTAWNKYLLFVLCLAITLLLAWSFDTLTDLAWKKLTTRKKKA